MAYKNIIPELVSLDTNIKSLWGFSLSENFDFYRSSEKQKINFKISVGKVKVPKDYEFRNGFYSRKDGIWYYDKRFLGIISLRFQFNPEKKEFITNRWYLWIPFAIGRILPFGRHVEDIIQIELLKLGYVLFQGTAFSLNGKNIGIVGPSFNGKTHLLQEILKKGLGRVISDDFVLIDFANSLIYPLSYKFNAIGIRSVQKKISRIINTNAIITKPVEISKLYFIQNMTVAEKDKVNQKVIGDFVFLCSLFFLDNRFAISYLVEERLLDDIWKRIDELRNSKFDVCEFFSISDFNFNFLNLSNDKESQSKRAVE